MSLKLQGAEIERSNTALHYSPGIEVAKFILFAGCKIANAARTYLILVSLLWNAVEAVNMYLMLVKVFNSEFSHFLTKASVIAWGKYSLLSKSSRQTYFSLKSGAHRFNTYDRN